MIIILLENCFNNLNDICFNVFIFIFDDSWYKFFNLLLFFVKIMVLIVFKLFVIYIVILKIGLMLFVIYVL